MISSIRGATNLSKKGSGERSNTKGETIVGAPQVVDRATNNKDLLRPINKEVNKKVITLGFTIGIIEGECDNLECTRIMGIIIIGKLLMVCSKLHAKPLEPW